MNVCPFLHTSVERVRKSAVETKNKQTKNQKVTGALFFLVFLHALEIIGKFRKCLQKLLSFFKKKSQHSAASATENETRAALNAKQVKKQK